MNQEIVDEMLSQHKILQESIEGVEKSLDRGDFKEASALVKDFGSRLKDHIKRENEIFYPEVLRAMEEKDMDTTDTKKFIAEMEDIEKEVTESLDKYEEVKSKEDMKEVEAELRHVLGLIKIRIETEESVVYTYCDSL